MKGASTTQAAVQTAKPAGTIMLQRQCACGQHTLGGEECRDCRKSKLTLQRHANGNMGAGFASPVVHEVLRSPGQALPRDTRKAMESSLGHDFSRVRVHVDTQAADSTRAVRARAYTVGHHVVFAEGQYSPATREGRRLLAHELTHVVQQGAGANGAVGRIPISNDERYEREAHRAGEAMAGGQAPGNEGRVIAGGASAMVMRQQAAETGQAGQPSAQPGATPEANAPQPSGPGPYNGCRDQQSVVAARTEASTKAGNAVALLNNVQNAAQLLDTHFHLNATEPQNQADLNRVRAQFVRMQTALNSGIRIWCRSAPPPGPSAPRPTMPVDPACARVNAESTSCAGGNTTATVTLCEMALIGMSDGPLPKTILHEFAHIACDNNPTIHSGGRAGGEVYYDGSRLPGTTPNVLDQADSYAWFAMQAPASQTAATNAAEHGSQGSNDSGLPGWAIALIAAGAVGAVAGLIGLGVYLGNHH